MSAQLMQNPTSNSSQAEDLTREIATQAYLYAYPLLLMDITRQQLTNVTAPTDVPAQGPQNRFIHVREFPDPKFKIVIRPNVDTLYSTAWLDLAAEPIVLSVPRIDRYFMSPMLCMWTDVFAAPGTRTTGANQAHNYLVVGPNFKGNIPAGMETIQSPTRYVWIIGRTQTNGKLDYSAVHKIQDEYKLTPLSGWGKKDYVPSPGKVDLKIDMETPPPVQVERMAPAEFFARFANLLKDNPPLFYDYPLIHQLRRFGIEPGKEFDLNAQVENVQQALTRGAEEGMQTLKAEAKKATGTDAQGWNESLRGGFYGNDYLERALVAFIGLGANLTQDAVYPSLSTDADGRPLDGNQNYVLRFEKGDTPPVRAFWSVTVYDAEGYLVPNSLGRCALGDRDGLKTTADGSVELYLQPDSPGKEKETNWLPVPRKPFNLLLRMYWPSEQILNHTWKPPEVRREAAETKQVA